MFFLVITDMVTTISDIEIRDKLNDEIVMHVYGTA